MKKTLSLVLSVVLLFCLAACSSGYNSPSKAAEAYFKAYEKSDADAVLNCYPESARSYFVDIAGGEDAFAQSVAEISEAGTVTYQIVREEAITDLIAVDKALENIGDVFEYTEASAVILKTYITFSDGSTYPEDTSNLEETQLVTVKVDGKWYVFADELYTDDTTQEEGK